MNGTRKSAEDREYWGSYIGVFGLLFWGISLGFHAQALAGVFLIAAACGGIMWGAEVVFRRLREDREDRSSRPAA